MILEKFPILNPETLIHIWPNIGFVSYSIESNLPRQIISFNKTGIAILSLCDGVHQVQSISKELAERYQASYEEVSGKVIDFLQQMEQVLPLSFEDQPRQNNLRMTGSTEYITPIHAAIELTYKCNLRCRHCYVDSTSDSKKQLSLDQIHQVFEKLNGWGVRVIELTGGEPTIHPDFPEILQTSFDYFDLIAVVTNGTHMTNELLNVIAKSLKKVVVQIDLDGAIPEYVDWFRGCLGTFQKEVDAIRKVSQLGVLLRVAMCVTPKNLDQIEQTAILARSLGATSLGISTVYPIGRGSDPSLLLSVEELQKLSKIWSELLQRYPKFIFHLEDLAVQKAQGNCGAGGRSVTITPLGQVKLCQMSSADVMCYGNVFIQSARELFNLPVVSYITQLEPPSLEICGECPNLGFCMQCITRGLIKGRELGADFCKWYALHRDHLLTATKV
jgi:radical SAM protein with 4Fe4S-binding SPASM domain